MSEVVELAVRMMWPCRRQNTFSAFFLYLDYLKMHGFTSINEFYVELFAGGPHNVEMTKDIHTYIHTHTKFE